MVKISIVVPVYNVEKYLPECLDSIINQRLKDIEIICVDDGSKDNSLEIIKQYQAKDSRIKIITKPNSGYGNSMNRGMSCATGEYIGIVESDDWVDKNMFLGLYNAAKKHNAQVVKSDYYEFSTTGGKKEEYIMTPTDPGFYNKVISAYDSEDIFYFKMNTWTGIYKTDFLREFNIGHNETPGASYQDNGFWFKTISLANRVVFVDRAYYHYRQDNPNSSINSKGKIFCMCDEYAFIRAFVDANEKIKELHLGTYLVKKYHNYFYTYERVAQEYKLAFLKRFAEEFKESIEKGELNKTLFLPRQSEILDSIVEDYENFYYNDTIRRLNEKYTGYVNDLNFIKTKGKIKKSASISEDPYFPSSEIESLMSESTADKPKRLLHCVKLADKLFADALASEKAEDIKAKLLAWSVDFMCGDLALLPQNEQNEAASALASVWDKYTCGMYADALDIWHKPRYEQIRLMAISDKNERIKAFSAANEKLEKKLETFRAAEEYAVIIRKLNKPEPRMKKLLSSLKENGIKNTLIKIKRKLKGLRF